MVSTAQCFSFEFLQVLKLELFNNFSHLKPNIIKSVENDFWFGMVGRLSECKGLNGTINTSPLGSNRTLLVRNQKT